MCVHLIKLVGVLSGVVDVVADWYFEVFFELVFELSFGSGIFFRNVHLARRRKVAGTQNAHHPQRK